MFKNQKGFAVQGIIAIVGLLLLTGGAYVISQKQKSNESNQNIIAESNSENTPAETKCSNGATNYPRCNADLPASDNWATYTNVRNGYELKYPSNWKIEENLGVSVRVFNPERKGKDDTDQPTEAVSVSFKQTQCKDSAWTKGFALVDYSTSCVSNGVRTAEINAVAFDEMGKIIEEKIISSFKFDLSNTGPVSKPDTYIKVIYPNGGEALAPGRKVSVGWQTQGIIQNSPIRIDLVNSQGVFVKSIASNIQNSGSYEWTIPSDVTNGYYRIAVSIIQGVYTDRSDNLFTISSDAGLPYISSIMPASGPIDTIVTLNGQNLAGFEGDLDAYIENDKGETAYLGSYGSSVYPRTDQITVKVPAMVCRQNNSYSGKPCTSYLSIVPGDYYIYAYPWGKMSNKVRFTVTGSGVSNMSILTHYDSGITFRFPQQWRFDASKNYFITPDYREGQSGARIEFVYGLVGTDWQKTVSAMYGSKSINELILINGKSVLKTTYASEPQLVGLSLPFANNTAFVSLFLRYEAQGRPEASYKESYEPVIRQMIADLVLPLGTLDAWHAYKNTQYGFSFNHPPLTSVVQSTTYSKSSVASYEVFVRYGFHQLLFVYTKPATKSLKAWYENTYSGVSPVRGPVEKTVNGYSAIDVTFDNMANPTRHLILSKDNIIVEFLFNADPEGPLDADHQKMLDSFLFIN